MPRYSGIILAGGASRRMGRDKAWIELGGKALVRRVIDRLRLICEDVLIVAGDLEPFQSLDVRLTGDLFPGNGSLGGIYSGLSAARHSPAIVVGCDMPFLNTRLIGYMLALAEEYDIVIPSALDPSKPKRIVATQLTAKDAELHPLHAVYSRNCLEPIAARLREGDLRMISFHSDVRVRVVSAAEIERFDPKHISLFNVNSPEQLRLAERWLEQG
jgi:molybdenum cofactor guanylyltransferase